jgi:hypothetical protein
MPNEFYAGDIIAHIGGPEKFWVHGFMSKVKYEYYILRQPYCEWDSTITGDQKYIEGNYVKVGEFRNGEEVWVDE